MASAHRLLVMVLILASVFGETAVAVGDDDCAPAEAVIPAQHLLDALICLSRRTGVSFFAQPDVLVDVQSRPVDTREPLDAVLAQLTEGTQVEARLEGGTILVRRRPNLGLGLPSEGPSVTPGRLPDRIVVRGFRSALANAFTIKRSANQIVDVISGEEFGQFPDQNVAEALQRIAGLSLTRLDGEGKSISIRGLEPTFTRVEIDGRTTLVTFGESSPERASALSIFASDLFETVEVIKSPTAADTEGGLGGIVRLHTPDPIDLGELRWGVEASLTDADLRDAAEPGGSAFYSNVFAGGRAGVLLSGTYERLDRRLDRIQSNLDWLVVDAALLADAVEPDLTALIGGRYPGRTRQEQRSGDGERINLNGKLQLQVGPEFALSVGGLFAVFHRDEVSSRVQTEWRQGVLTGGVLNSTAGTLSEAEFMGSRTDYRQFRRSENIEASGLSVGLDWMPGAWRFATDASYSSSTEDRQEHRVDGRIEADGPGSYNVAGGPRYPQLQITSAAADPATLALNGLIFQRRVISLEETQFQFDVERDLQLGPIVSLQAGARYASARFERLQGAISGSVDGLTYADGEPGFALDGTFGQRFGEDLLAEWPSIDPAPFFEARPLTEEFVYNDEDLWTVSEDVSAIYGLANFDIAFASSVSARGNIGLRTVRTEYAGQGRIDVDTVDREFLIDDAPVIEHGYTAVLPAANVVFVSDGFTGIQVRGAISRALARPTIDEIRPGENVDAVTRRIVRGNPGLEPFLAWQYDLGVERYFGASREGMVAAALFYKDVENFIVPEQLVEERAFPAAGLPEQLYLVDTFRNGGEASIFGVELNVQTPFDFASGALSDFGVFANYTYTESEFVDDNGNRTSFPGAATHSYNVVGYYERDGFSGRLAYNYRGDHLMEPSSSPEGSNAVFGEAQGRLDFAARYRFKNGVRLSIDALNLTEQQSYHYYDQAAQLQNLEFEGRIFTFAIGLTH